MGGVSGPKTVSGAGGYGKVELRFRKIADKKKPKYGACLFFFGLACLLFKVVWGWPGARRDVVIPILHFSLGLVDSVRLNLHAYMTGQTSFAISNGPFDVKMRTPAGADTGVASLLRDDTSGYLFIKASSLESAVYAQGYAHATDRLGQMDLRRRLARGTLSEALGKKHLESDKLYRTLGLHQLATQDWYALQEAAGADGDGASTVTEHVRERAAEQVLYLEAYSSGVNTAAAAQIEWVLPFSFYTYVGSWWNCLWRQKLHEVEPWHPIDTLVLLRLQAFQWSHGWEKEISLELLQKAVGVKAAVELLHMAQPTQHGTAHSPFPDNCRKIKSLSGNIWATAPTANGSRPATVFADFPASSEYQNRYYLNDMRWTVAVSGTETEKPQEKTTKSVRGMSEPGIPLVISGQNEQANWSLAVADVDTEDLYYEEFREVSADSSRSGSESNGIVCGGDATPCTEIEIKAQGRWQPAKTRVEHITVAPTTPKEKEGPYSVPHLVVTSSHGPVVGNLTVSKISIFSFSSTRGESSKSIVKLYANASICSQALRQPSDIHWLLNLATAENSVDFAIAADAYKPASMHLVFSSAAGIGHVVTGAPVRRVGTHMGNVPVSGSTGEYDWLDEEEVVATSTTTTSGSEKCTRRKADIFTSKEGSIIALEDKLASNDHALDVIYGWVNAPHNIFRALALQFDLLSATALQLTELILAAPSLSESKISQEADEETRRKLTQITTILRKFDGRYDFHSIAPPLLEAVLEDLSDSLLGEASHLVGLLRGAPFAPVSRDTGQVSLLVGRKWMALLLNPLNATMTSTTAAAEADAASNTWSLPVEKIDSLVYTAVLKAQSWAEAELGINKNYKNTHWKWGHVHRTTGRHPATYHTIINSIMSMPATERRGASDTLETTATGYDLDATTGGNIMEHTRDTSSFYLRGYQPAVQFIASHGGIDSFTNRSLGTIMMAGIAVGQSEHIGSTFGNRKREVNRFSPLHTPTFLPGITTSSPSSSSDASASSTETDAKEGL